MERFKRIAPTDRVLRLRDYYINNSPMSVDRDITVWHCHRSLMLYLEGWEKSEDAPTARMRRADNSRLMRGSVCSRTEAKFAFTLDEFRAEMDGIYTTTAQPGSIDECPMAYKKPERILNAISDTVSVEQLIRPIYNFKSC